jgi:hypothetical protein
VAGYVPRRARWSLEGEAKGRSRCGRPAKERGFPKDPEGEERALSQILVTTCCSKIAKVIWTLNPSFAQVLLYDDGLSDTVSLPAVARAKVRRAMGKQGSIPLKKLARLTAAPVRF